MPSMRLQPALWREGPGLLPSGSDVDDEVGGEVVDAAEVHQPIRGGLDDGRVGDDTTESGVGFDSGPDAERTRLGDVVVEQILPRQAVAFGDQDDRLEVGIR